MSKNMKLSLSNSVHFGVRILVLIALGITSLMACAPPTQPPPQPTEPPPIEPLPQPTEPPAIEPSSLVACVDFEDQTLGATFVVPDLFTASGTAIQVVPFQWGNGTWTSTGPGASVRDDMPLNQGNKSLFVNNVNLGFDLESSQCIKIQYCELGGNVNLLINGMEGNDEDFQAFNGVDFNGVQVSVNVVDPQENCGEIRLEGNFEKYYFQEQWWITFAIGGQELFIDNICPCE